VCPSALMHPECVDGNGMMIAFFRMTVVEAYLNGVHYHQGELPKFSGLPSPMKDIMIQAIAINSGYTSRLIVRTNNCFHSPLVIYGCFLNSD
jgi:hypothetical protein